MNYKDLKNGDVIKIIDYTIGEESTTISIFNKVEQGTNLGDKIYTYADLDVDYDYFSVEKNSPNAYYIANYYGFELATEEEKNKLFEKLFLLYTEVYDTNWNKYFTDSSYYEIEVFVTDTFCIEVVECDDDLIYPKIVDEVVKYIWCRCCEVLGMSSGFEEESDDIMVSLEKTIKYFEPILKTYCSEECLKELMNGYITSVTGIKKSEQEKHIEHMLSDNWEGNEEILIPEDKCSKPFNTPKILGEN